MLDKPYPSFELKPARHKIYTLILIIGFSLLLGLITASPLAQIVKGGDRELYLYIGMLISKGYVPYVDVFDNKPPLIYFLASQGWWGLWLVNNFTLSLSAVVFYRFCQRYLCYPLGLALLYIILLHFPVMDGGGLTYEFTVGLAMIASCIVLSEKPRFFILGLLCGMVFFTQVNNILGIAPLAAYAVIFKAWPASEKRFICFIKASAQFLLGFVLFSSVILSYFAYHHALKNLFDDAFLFNLSVYVPHTNHFGLIGTLQKYFHGAKAEYLLAFLLTIVPANLILMFKKTQPAFLRNWTIVLFIALIFDGISVSLSGWFVSFYYLNTVVYISLNIAVFLASVRLFLPDSYIKTGLSILVLICFFVCLHTARHDIAKFTDFIRHPSRPTAYENYMKPYESLVYDIKGQNGQLYVYRKYGLGQALYTDLGIKAPSPWIYHGFWDWYSFWDPKDLIFKGIIADINQQRTKYIMDFSLSSPSPRADVNKIWQAMLAAHYQKTKPLYCSTDDYGDNPKLCGWLYVRKN